jgi:predicted metal-dependent peptidase
MDITERISMCLLRVRARMPFFGVLALFAEHRLSTEVPTAATNGRSIIFNPGFAATLRPEQLDAVMVHELLHAALLHTTRRGEREPVLWNIAADIVVNGIVRKEKGLTLPGDPLLDLSLEGFEVEEVYRILESKAQRLEAGLLAGDLLIPVPGQTGASAEEVRALAAHWRTALNEAMTMARQAGKLPAGMERHVDMVLEPRLDWRSILWRFIVRTPIDYSGFDRRFLGRGLYLETLEGESVSLRVAVDTSGSISQRDLASFLAELREIVRLYPNLEAQLYYCDAELYGPFPLDSDGLKRAQGGGGTSFIPFFERMAREVHSDIPSALVYLTDGHGAFPREKPELPVLWVVAAGGLPSNKFPFGEVARLDQ